MMPDASLIKAFASEGDAAQSEQVEPAAQANATGQPGQSGAPAAEGVAADNTASEEAAATDASGAAAPADASDAVANPEGTASADKTPAASEDAQESADTAREIVSASVLATQDVRFTIEWNDAALGADARPTAEALKPWLQLSYSLDDGASWTRFVASDPASYEGLLLDAVPVPELTVHAAEPAEPADTASAAEPAADEGVTWTYRYTELPSSFAPESTADDQAEPQAVTYKLELFRVDPADADIEANPDAKIAFEDENPAYAAPAYSADHKTITLTAAPTQAPDAATADQSADDQAKASDQEKDKSSALEKLQSANKAKKLLPAPKAALGAKADSAELAADEPGVTIDSTYNVGEVSATKTWNDNHVTDQRPAREAFASALVLEYQLSNADSQTDWTAVQSEAGYTGIGLTDEPVIDVNEALSAITPARAQADDPTLGLPKTITVVTLDPQTQEPVSASYTVTYRIREADAPSHYIITNGLSTDEGGLLNTIESDYSATIAWFDNDDAYNTRNADVTDLAVIGENSQLTTYTVMRFRSGESGHPETVADAHPTIVSGGDTSTWTIGLPDLPRYDVDGTPFVYSVKAVPQETSEDPTTNIYQQKYDNTTGLYDDELYDGGQLDLTLSSSTTFTAHKSWVDGMSETTEQSTRPNCQLRLFCIPEIADGTPIADAKAMVREMSPVEAFDYADVQKLNGDVKLVNLNDPTAEGADLLPTYDKDGKRLIYFALETGLSGDYASFIDNNAAQGVSDYVKNLFTTEIKDDNGSPAYVLNGGSVDNKLYAFQPVSVSKTLAAEAIQYEYHNIQVKFRLERLTSKTEGEGGSVILTWEDAAKDEISDYNPENPKLSFPDDKVELTLGGGLGGESFWAEIPTLRDSSSLKVAKYDLDTGEPITYRWVEVGVRMSSNDEWIPVSRSSDSATMEDDFIIEDVEYSDVCIGDRLSGIGEQGRTTAYFTPSSTTRINTKNNSSSTSATNTLAAKERITITKTWDPWDEREESITVQAVGSNGVSTPITLTKAEDEDTANQIWRKSVDLPRFDEDGIEIFYTVQELQSGSWFSNLAQSRSVGEAEAPLAGRVMELDGAFKNTKGDDPAIKLDVAKVWQDGDDALTRHNVKVGVFLNTDPTTPLETATLTEANNWFERIVLSESAHPGITLDARNMVVRELSVNGVPVTYSGGDYSTGMLSEASSSHNLQYTYEVTNEKDDATTSGHGYYTITNTRVGELDMTLSKEWKTGATSPQATFELVRSTPGIQGEEIMDLQALSDAGQLTLHNFDLDAAGLSVTSKEATATQSLASASLELSHLVKYDEQGCMYSYELRESKLDGQEFHDGSVTLNSETYKSNANTKIEIAGPEKHNTGDVYKWSFSNSLSGGYNLKAYKYWRDAGADVVRPHISGHVYRVSSKYLSGSGSLASQVVAAPSEHKQEIDVNFVWNTTDPFMWECDFGAVPRYDDEGFHYVYYLVETMTGNPNGEYRPLYLNGVATAERAATGKTTAKEALGTKTSDLENDGASGTDVLILSDGEVGHKGTEEGSFCDYYAATTMNYPVATRTLKGGKIWNLPTGWNFTDNQMPDVTLQVVRTYGSFKATDPAHPESTDRYANSSIEYALENSDETGATVVNAFTLTHETGYTFTCSEDTSVTPAQPLARYDDFGVPYNYYVYEPTAPAGYTTSNIIYSIENATATNVYQVEPPYVKVPVSKTWTNLSSKAANLAPAKFELHAVASDVDITMATVTLDPEEVQPGEANAVTKTYTFTKPDPGVVEGDPEHLPYLAPTGEVFTYYVEEVFDVAGYTTDAEKTKEAVFPADPDVNYTYVSSNLAFANAYDNARTGEKTKVTVAKNWTMGNGNLDLSAWNPQSITLTLSRSWNTATVNGVSMPGGTDVKVDDYTLTPPTNWDGLASWTQEVSDLDVYAPNGQKYTYSVKSETFPVSFAAADQYTKSYRGTAATNKLATVDISGSKSWAYVNGESTQAWAEEDYKLAKAAGSLPQSITFLLQTKQGTSWVNRPTGKAASAPFSLSYGGQVVVGKQYVINDELSWNNFKNMSFSFTGLPKYASDAAATDDNLIEYRVVEVWTWSDGTTSTVAETTSAVTTPTSYKYQAPSVTVADDGNGKYTFTNKLPGAPVKMGKVWADDYGNRENTRPVTLGLKFNGTVSRTISNSRDGNEQTTTLFNVPLPKYEAGADPLESLRAALATTYPAASSIAEPTVPSNYVIDENAYAWRLTGEEGSQVPTVFIGNALSNSSQQTHKIITLNADKFWANDAGWAGISRPIVKYKLQYRVDDGTDEAGWTDASAASSSIIGISQDFEKTLDYVTDTKDSVSWEGAYKYYWPAENPAGTPIPIRYRIIETLYDADGTTVLQTKPYEPSSTTPPAWSHDISDESPNAIGYTNSLQTIPLSLKKTWYDEEGSQESALTKAQLQTLINLGRLPKQVTFGLYYSATPTVATSWTKITPENGKPALTLAFGTVDMVGNNGAAVQLSVGNVPKYDSAGQQLSYLLREETLTYKDNSTVDVSWTNFTTTSAAAGSLTVQSKTAVAPTAATTLEFKNEYSTTSASVTKAWADGHNRDGQRPTAVTFNLLRDGAAYNSISTNASADVQAANFCTITADTTGGWTVKWTNLPAAKDNGSGLSVYTVTESAVTGYTGTTWSQDNTTITNTHEPQLFSVNAKKVWSPEDDPYAQMPKTVTLKLQWSTDNSTWQDVTKVTDIPTLDADPGDNVFTTSDVSQTLTLGTGQTWADLQASWADLPAYVNGGKLVSYRAVETTSPAGYTSSSTTVSYVEGATAAPTIVVTNTLKTVGFEVQKTWTGLPSGFESELMPTSVKVKLQQKAKTEGATWTDVAAGTVDLTATGAWKHTWSNLNSAYEYQAVEASMTWGEGESAKTVTVGADGTVGNFTCTSSTTQATDTANGKTALTNTFDQMTSFTFTKKWNDNHNRDNLRGNVTFTLMRDGVEYCSIYTGDSTDYAAKNCTVTETGETIDGKYYATGWTIEWAKLPVYQNGSTAQSVYTVEETMDSPDGYVASRSEDGKTITNTHTPKRFTIEAYKVWDDADDRYYGRPEKLYFSLWWSTTPNDESSWQKVEKVDDSQGGSRTGVVDVGTNVTTTSAFEQTLPGEDKTWASPGVKAAWGGLPEKVLVVGEGKTESVPVYYRVMERGEVEEEGQAPVYYVDGYILSYSKDKISYSDAQLPAGSTEPVATTTLTNTLDGMKYEVQKTWAWPEGVSLSDAQKEALLPASITVQLQHRSGKGDWTDAYVKTEEGDVLLTCELTAENSWTYTFEELHKDKKYRALEVSMTWGTGADAKTIYVNDQDEDIRELEGFIGNFAYTSEMEESTPTEPAKTILTNTLDQTGFREISKVWSDGANRDDVRTESVQMQLVRDDENWGDPKVADAASDWKCLWEDLPLYQDGKPRTQDNLSVYTVEEVESQALEPYEAAFDADAQTLTNTHAPALFSVQATKVWDDGDDPYGLRPKSAEFKLQWSLDGEEWEDVTHVDAVPAPDADDGMAVFTTSAVEQTLTADADGVWSVATWENLPAYVCEGEAVSYRAIESVELPSFTADPSATVTYAQAEGDVATTQITNVLQPASWTVSEKFEMNGCDPEEFLPDSIQIELEYSDDDGATWKKIPTAAAKADLTADNKWEWEYENLNPVYTYRVAEVSMTWGDEVVPLVGDEEEGTDGAYIYSAGTDKEARHTDLLNVLAVGSLSVQKKWDEKDAASANKYRPKSIEVQLLRNGTVYKTGTLDAKNNWTCTWDTLPVFMRDVPKRTDESRTVYTVVELDADGTTVIEDGGACFANGQYVRYVAAYANPDGQMLEQDDTVSTVVTNTLKDETPNNATPARTGDTAAVLPLAGLLLSALFAGVSAWRMRRRRAAEN